ncbi:Membrane carboxypeptidase (penicillin-binding protein) [Friedmanniella luteola]|uniref:Membrane carboxypeptidase (Penicillin-binding protein) n=2 Tax=Friedmanniella luteola TaxID=546871 RepID=A0A1H1LDS0_9ACTN|nr:Membrane carboxypeptidase (penicillin-binding protein) [Friedmanniella luteola]
MWQESSRTLSGMPFSPKRAGSVAYSLVMFVIVSVLAGVLVAGLFVPLAGMAGVSSKAAATELESLPTELSTPAPPTRSRVLMANGKTLAYFYDENRVPVELDEIAPVMRQAQLAIEDHRYYEHGALDLKGTLRALVRNSTSDSGTQGGSSITQQYVKMVQVEACNGDRECIAEAQAKSMERKVRELRYAIALEKKFSKDEILERYLNIAYYGEGAYGVQAAARHYYSTDAEDLNLAQAAMLAGLVQNPDANNPVDNRAAALDRRDVVVNRMLELDLISAAQAKKAKKAGFDEDKVKATRAGCVGTKYPFLCDYVRRSLLTMPSLGKTEDDRKNMLNRGGLTIQTAIDTKTQDLAQKKVSSVVGPTDPLISTMNMIQPGTGLIVAMAQSRPVMGSDSKDGETYWNLAADPAMGGIQGYQAGSTFKTFTMAAALEKGIPISKKFNARSPFDFTGKTYQSCVGTETVPKYRVSNSVGHSTTINMTEAAEYSVNTYFVQLELAAGLCNVTKMAEKVGVKLGTQDRDLVDFYQSIPSFTLGSVEVSPLSMAEAYATFAARGVHCNPIIVSKVTNRNGKQLEVPDAGCEQVVEPAVADGVNKILKSVMDRGTGLRAKVYNGYDMAGKTGTIDSNEAVWFAGYTPEVAGVAMISIDNTRKPFIKKKPGFRRTGVKNYSVPSTDVFLQGSGSGDAGRLIWKPVMEDYLKKVPDTSFKAPSREVQVGKQVRVPSLYGLGISAATKKLEKEGFTVERRQVYSRASVGSFLGFSPGSNASVPEFSTIYANYSAGRDPAEVAAERRAREEAAQAREDAAEAREKAAEAAAKAREDARKKAEAEKKKADAEKKGDG